MVVVKDKSQLQHKVGVTADITAQKWATRSGQVMSAPEYQLLRSPITQH